MYKLILIFLLVVNTSHLFAQESILSDLNADLLQKYIELAKTNYPKKIAIKAKEARAKSSLNSARFSLLDAFNANYYWSPKRRYDTTNIVGGIASNNQLMQRGFMAGVSVNLGSLLSKPSSIKAAKAEYEAAKAENTEYQMNLTTEVKSRYYDYLLAKKQLALNNFSMLNAKTIYSDAKIRFERGQILIDQYTIAKNAADQSEASMLASEVGYLKAKNALEDLIGVPVESVR